MAESMVRPRNVKSRPWLIKWILDEEFWKAITINVSSAGLVAVLAYVFAVVVGYVAQPQFVPFGVGLAYMAVFLVATNLMSSWTMKKLDEPGWDNPGRIRQALVILGLFGWFILFGVGAFVVVSSVMPR